MERINGYLVLDDLKKIEKEKSGHHVSEWFSDGEKEHFFKVVDKTAQLKELFYSTLLLENNYEAANYDLAIYKGQQGIISENLNPKNLPSFTIKTIIDHYLNTDKYKNQKLYNIEKLNEILTRLAYEENRDYDERERKKLLLSFIMQIMFANSDLRETNLEILIGRETISLFPFYDFEFCGTINLKFYQYSKKYFLKYDARPRSRETPLETFQIFLNSGTKEEIEYFREILSIMQEVKADKIFKICEEKADTRFSLIKKLQIGHNFKQNLRNIEEIIKSTN